MEFQSLSTRVKILPEGISSLESMAEGSEGQVMVGSAMVAYSALRHDVGGSNAVPGLESMAAGSAGQGMESSAMVVHPVYEAPYLSGCRPVIPRMM